MLNIAFKITPEGIAFRMPLKVKVLPQDCTHSVAIFEFPRRERGRGIGAFLPKETVRLMFLSLSSAKTLID